MWSICSVIAWAAAVALLPPAATAARLDLWPTSTGRTRGLNESRYYAHGEERIGWDLPSYGTIRVLSGVAAGSYIVSKDDRRDGQSAFIRADTDAQLASVFEFYYRTDVDVYMLTGVSFKFGPGTDDGWGERMCLSVHGTLPDDTLPNDETRVIAHQYQSLLRVWKFTAHADGGFVMQPMPHWTGGNEQKEAGYYLAVPEDVPPRDEQSRFVSVVKDADKAARVEIEVP